MQLHNQRIVSLSDVRVKKEDFLSIIYCLAQHDAWSWCDANPVFFNKKINIGLPEHSLPPIPYLRQHLIFVLPLLTPSQSGRHIGIAPYLKGPLNGKNKT